MAWRSPGNSPTTTAPSSLHRWRWSNLSAWTELDLHPGELVVRTKGTEQRLPLADLRTVTLRSQELTPGRSVVLHFHAGEVVALSDWAPQGFGGRQQEQVRLALSRGLIVEAVPPTRRSRPRIGCAPASGPGVGSPEILKRRDPRAKDAPQA